MIEEALAHIRKTESRTPKIGLILGSGLGSLADAATQTTVFSTADLPHYPKSTVVGHAGKLIFGELNGVEVVFVQGRVHFYEGHPIRSVIFPVLLLHALGVEKLIVTNAAGGINAKFEIGDLMLIDDHINLALQNPLTGSVIEGMPRFPDMSQPYDIAWRKQAHSLALEHGFAPQVGTYIWVTGPSYETQAEIKFFRLIGADAVGMSTVPEVLAANALGMKVLGISTITNMASDLQGKALNHEEVMEVGKQIQSKLSAWVQAIIKHA